jgi:hypothetical protein
MFVNGKNKNLLDSALKIGAIEKQNDGSVTVKSIDDLRFLNKKLGVE